MEQAGKRQQARNPGNTERAQEQIWCQASKVVERKGFIMDQIKKLQTKQNKTVHCLFQHLMLLSWKELEGRSFLPKHSSKGVDAFKHFLKLFFK